MLDYAETFATPETRALVPTGNRLPGSASQEVIPIRPGLPGRERDHLLANPDPFLTWVKPGRGLEWYVSAAAQDPHGLGAAIGIRKDQGLACGCEWVAGHADGAKPTQDAEDLRDFAAAFWQRIPQTHYILSAVLDAIFWGWRPLQLIWNASDARRPSVWQWRPTRSTRGPARLVHTPSAIIDKRPDDFRFTHDRKLALVRGGFAVEEIFRGEEQELRWWAPSYSSLDNPYGESTIRTSGAAVMVEAKLRVRTAMLTGADRAAGVAILRKKGGGNTSKAFADVMADLRAYLELMTSKNLMVQPPDWEIDYLTNATHMASYGDLCRYLDAGTWLALTGTQLGAHIGQTAASGSRAAMRTELEVRSDKVRADGRWLGDQVSELGERVIRWNFEGVDPVDLPRFRRRRELKAENLSVYVAARASDPQSFPPPDGDAVSMELAVPVLPEDQRPAVEVAPAPVAPEPDEDDEDGDDEESGR